MFFVFRMDICSAVQTNISAYLLNSNLPASFLKPCVITGLNYRYYSVRLNIMEKLLQITTLITLLSCSNHHKMKMIMEGFDQQDSVIF